MRLDPPRTFQDWWMVLVLALVLGVVAAIGVTAEIALLGVTVAVAIPSS